MKRRLMLIGLLLAFLAGSDSVGAHDFTDTAIFSGTGILLEQEWIHEDEDPFKGWFTLTATNTGTEAWGDFHFEIFQYGNYAVDSVVFKDSGSGGMDPTWSGSDADLSWTIGNNGHSLDLYYYDDPVPASEAVTFSVYADNTASQVPFFGVAAYPTPVPVPAAVWLLGSGLLAMGLQRKSSPEI